MNIIWAAVVVILTSCCCRQHLRTLGCQLLWAAAGHRLPLLKLWIAPPDTGGRMKGTMCLLLPQTVPLKPNHLINNKNKNTVWRVWCKIISTVSWSHRRSYISYRKHLKLAACSNTPSHSVQLANYAEKPEKHTSIWRQQCCQSGARQIKCSTWGTQDSGQHCVIREDKHL